MTAEEMGWPGSFRSFRMSDLEHPEEYPAYVRSDLYEQVERERDEANADRDRWYVSSFEATKRAEAAERLAGARVVTLPDDDDKLAEMVEDFHRGSVAFANDPDEFSHLIEFTPARLRSFISALAEPAGEVGPVQVGWAYRDKRWDEDRWHVCGWEKPREAEGREVRPIFIGTTPPDASAMRKALERFDSVAPDESIGCYGGSGQWIELGTVADLRALAGAKP